MLLKKYSIFLSEDNRRWCIRVKAIRTDVCNQYKVLKSTVIPDMAEGDKFMVQTMKATITEELRSKNRVDDLPPKVPVVEKSTEVPPHSKKSRRGTDLRSGKAKKRAAEGALD